MLWLLLLPVLWYLGKKAIWLYAVDRTMKQQRRRQTTTTVGDISQFPEIDTSDLEPLTQELLKLGFVTLCDQVSSTHYEPDTPPGVEPVPGSEDRQSSSEPQAEATTRSRGVGRIFAHPEHGCYASLISVVSRARYPANMNRPDLVKVAPFRTAIMTLSGTGDDSWGFATLNRSLEPFSLLYRHPRHLNRRMVGASVKELLDSHLSERDAVAVKGRFRWDLSPTLQKYEENEARTSRYIRSVNERATTLGVAWLLLTYRLKNHERWMGELA